MKLRDPSISDGSRWILMSRKYNFRNDFAFVLGYRISVLMLRAGFLKIYSISFWIESGISYIAFSLTALFICMNSFKDFFRNWFGYSRRERRSTFILLNIIVIITGIRYIFPFHDISLKEIPLDLMENQS